MVKLTKQEYETLKMKFILTAQYDCHLKGDDIEEFAVSGLHDYLMEENKDHRSYSYYIRKEQARFIPPRNFRRFLYKKDLTDLFDDSDTTPIWEYSDFYHPNRNRVLSRYESMEIRELIKTKTNEEIAALYDISACQIRIYRREVCGKSQRAAKYEKAQAELVTFLKTHTEKETRQTFPSFSSSYIHKCAMLAGHQTKAERKAEILEFVKTHTKAEFITKYGMTSKHFDWYKRELKKEVKA